jgi:flagellar M-ring protein FliF
MSGQMSDALQQLRAFHDGLDATRRRVLYVACGAAFAVIVGVGVWASQTQYEVLSRPADADERAAITTALARAGIAYRVASDGVGVEVPAEHVLDARAAAAGEGGIVGIEGLEKLDPWITPVQEQMHKLRMLQGELVRTLNGIGGVASSTVHLNMPERSEFLLAQARATAAVTLRAEEGVTLSRDVARSVASLVSHAVAGMTPEDVTVVDAASGRTLWGGGAEAAAGEGTPEQQARKREAELSLRVRDALARVLGSPDHVTVAVNLEVDNAAIQSTATTVDPDSATAVSERLETEGNASATAAGSPGSDSNLPERAPASGGTARNRESTQTQYQVSTTQTTTVRPAGELKRISASVIVNVDALGALVAAGQDEKAVRADLEASTRAALGFDEERGDSVTVTFVKFAPLQLSDATTVAAAPVWERMAPMAVAALAVVLTFVFLVRPLAARIAAPAPVVARADEASPGDASAPTPESDDLGERLRQHVETFKRVSAEDLSELVRRETDNSAEVLRRWMRAS